MKKVELLAPAGNYETVLAAINAGADAIYLGAEKFSARAFADNLTEEELCKAIILCHLHDVKVYLTLNILLNSEEIKEVIALIGPLYNAGLDGIIVQDLGVISVLKSSFPDLSLHCSTQMSIMNDCGAALFKEQGIERIVPARELTIEEIKHIKNTTDIELECFIHGAMCYSYSGLCLMSSIIGGRSGNRGKCAGTCRLPFNYYDTEHGFHGEEYPISMKDMCTLSILPKLIEAGIDSFKIEGRMKSPEYCAGVTAMYRKYIDLYYSSPDDYKVSDKDIDILKKLYIRTDICSGYYEGKLGRDLLTMSQPGYNGNDESYIDTLRKRYVKEPAKLPINITCYMEEGSEIIMTFGYRNSYVTVSGGICETAKKAPLDEKRVSANIAKLGDTPFYAEDLSVTILGNVFVPMGALNELRRKGISDLLSEILITAGYRFNNKKASDIESLCKLEETIYSSGVSHINKEQDNLYSQNNPNSNWDVHVLTKEQLIECIKYDFDRLYIEHSIINEISEDFWIELNKKYIIYVSLPIIYRNNRNNYYDFLKKSIEDINKDTMIISGLLVHSYDEYKWACDNFDIQIVTDTNVYMHNYESVNFAYNSLKINSLVLPYELRISEYSKVIAECNTSGMDSTLIVYGNIPLMISAGCLKRTYSHCDHSDTISGNNYITDRLKHNFAVRSDCNICTNIIYNDRPLSLINYLDIFSKMNVGRFKINFTLENSQKTSIVLQAFLNRSSEGLDYLKKIDTCTGHLKRGV